MASCINSSGNKAFCANAPKTLLLYKLSDFELFVYLFVNCYAFQRVCSNRCNHTTHESSLEVIFHLVLKEGLLGLSLFLIVHEALINAKLDGYESGVGYEVFVDTCVKASYSILVNLFEECIRQVFVLEFIITRL